MSAFHGVRDIRELEGPAFFKLAYRLDSYQGAVAAAAAREAGEGPVIDAELYQQQQQYQESSLPVPAPDAEALTAEQLEAMYPAAPLIGQEVGLFEITKVTDGS